MSECQLVFTDYEQKSKASRFFWLFKPKETIYWEPFDLSLSFQNPSSLRFEGGLCKFWIRAEKTYQSVSVKLPSIEPDEAKTVTITNLTINELGYNAISEIIVQDKNGKQIPCKDNDDQDASIGRAYPLHLATREEMYQKYAVVVALLFSVLASILTIVNVLVSISR